MERRSNKASESWAYDAISMTIYDENGLAVASGVRPEDAKSILDERKCDQGRAMPRGQGEPLWLLLSSMVAWEADNFDDGEPINGADLVQQWSEWRVALIATLRRLRPEPVAEAISVNVITAAAGALDAMAMQIEQMRGMFPGDAAIDDALDAYEDARQRIASFRRVLALPAAPEQISALRLASAALAEALEVHVYDAAAGEKPSARCNIAAALQATVKALRNTGRHPNEHN